MDVVNEQDTFAHSSPSTNADEGGATLQGATPASWRQSIRHFRDRRAVRIGTQVVKLASTCLLVLAALVAYGLMDNRWYKVVVVEGNSMAPTFFAGDAVVITRPPEAVEVGMVLMLEVEGDLVTHRVVEVDDDGTFVTQGDANDHPDDYSQVTVDVVGQVRFHVPELGRLIARVQGELPRTTGAWWVDADESPANTLFGDSSPDAVDAVDGGVDVCSDGHAPDDVTSCEVPP